nr:cytidine deaminase [Pseudidiomarina sediminum]
MDQTLERSKLVSHKIGYDTTMNMQTEQLKTLRDAAFRASQNAYVPYSKFAVGAALLMRNGNVITGCNVENVSYGLANCAERTAVFRAIAEGYNGADIVAVVVYTPGQKAYAPCGACRQVLAEFLQPETLITSTSEQASQQWRLTDLLPDAFHFDVSAYRE